MEIRVCLQVNLYVSNVFSGMTASELKKLLFLKS